MVVHREGRRCLSQRAREASCQQLQQLQQIRKERKEKARGGDGEAAKAKRRRRRRRQRRRGRRRRSWRRPLRAATILAHARAGRRRRRFELGVTQVALARTVRRGASGSRTKRASRMRAASMQTADARSDSIGHVFAKETVPELDASDELPSESVRIASLSKQGAVVDVQNGSKLLHRFSKLERRSDWPLFKQSMELVLMNLDCHPSDIKVQTDAATQRQKDDVLRTLLENALEDHYLHESLFADPLPCAGHEPDLPGLAAWQALVSTYEERSVSSKMELYGDFMRSLESTRRHELTPERFARCVATMKGLAGQFRNLGASVDELVMLGFMTALNARGDNRISEMPGFHCGDSLRWTQFHELARDFMDEERRARASRPEQVQPKRGPSENEDGILCKRAKR